MDLYHGWSRMTLNLRHPTQWHDVFNCRYCTCSWLLLLWSFMLLNKKETLKCCQSPHQASAETASVGSESPVDIADYSSISARQGLSDSQKYDLAINDDDFRPGYKYIYPTRLEYGKQRRFQYDWLQRYKWLVYSKKENGGFCLPCMLFGQGQGGGDLGILVSRPMVNFTKAHSTTLPVHKQKECHQVAVTKLSNFITIMAGKRQSVRECLDTALGLAERVAANRRKLETIVDTELLCGRQNIAIRGHRDSIRQMWKQILLATMGTSKQSCSTQLREVTKFLRNIFRVQLPMRHTPVPRFKMSS